MHGIHHPQLAFCLVIFWDCHILCLQLALVCFQTLHCIICGIWLHFVAQSKNTKKVAFSISAPPKPSVNSTSNRKPMLEGCQCSHQEGSPASPILRPEQMAMEGQVSMEGQTPMEGQMPMEEPGQDLRHFVQGHPWPYAIQCRTQFCPSWIYLRRSKHLKRCHLCGEEWANSIQEPGHLFLKEDQLWDHPVWRINCTSSVALLHQIVGSKPAWIRAFWPPLHLWVWKVLEKR